MKGRKFFYKNYLILDYEETRFAHPRRKIHERRLLKRAAHKAARARVKKELKEAI